MTTKQHPNGVQTRPATREDQPRVFALIEQLTGESPNSSWVEVYNSHLRGERGAVIIAENDKEILGVATVSYNLTVRFGGEYCELEE